MNPIITAEQIINDFLYHQYNTCVNFVTRWYKYERMTFPNDYAIQCTTRDGLFKSMKHLVQNLGINFSIYKDNAFFKCIVLKDKEDIITISQHIKEVVL